MEGATGRTITSDRRRMDFCHLSRTDLTEKKLEYGHVCRKFFVSGQLSKDLGQYSCNTVAKNTRGRAMGHSLGHMLHAERLKLRRGRHHRDQQKFPDLETLPPEVGLSVLKHLNATDLCLASCVWSMAKDEVLWMGLCKATWNYATIYRKQRDGSFSFRRLYLILDEGSLTFNADPEAGIEYLVSQGVLDNHPRELAAFIHGTQALRWKPLRIFLENRPDVLDELVIRQNYRNQFLPNALRKFFLTIHAPEERGDYLQRLVEKFSQRFCQCNPDCGLTPGVIEVLCFALILLSVDLSSPHVKNKMSKREFIKNLRHATPETDPEFAGHLYDNIYLVGHVAPSG